MALALVPMMILGGVALIQLQGLLSDSVNANLQETAIVQAKGFDEWLDARQVDLEVIAHDSLITSQDRGTILEQLEFYRNRWPFFEALFMTDETGWVLANTDGLIDVSMNGIQPTQGALDGAHTFVSKATVSPVSGNIIVLMATPILRDGQIAGSITGVMAVGTLVERAADLFSGVCGDAYLIDSEGFVITPPRFSEELIAARMAEMAGEGDVAIAQLDQVQDETMREMNEAVTTSEIEALLTVQLKTSGVQAALTGETDVTSYENYRGHEVLGAHADVGDTGWLLMVEQEQAEALSPLYKIVWLLVWIFAALVFAIGLAAIFFARTIADPVRAMTAAANGIAQGNIEQNIAVHSRTEIGHMAEAFRRMIAYIQQTANVAERVSAGDLTISVEPQSESDILGTAFRRMIENLRSLVAQVQDNAQHMAHAGNQLNGVAQQTETATQQISVTIGQVATGNSRQAQSVELSKDAIADQLRAIEAIASGARRQEEAVQQAQALLTQQLAAAIAQVEETATAGDKVAGQAGSAAENGAEAVSKTIAGMEAIARANEQAGRRVAEMGRRSQEIGEIVQAIDEIAERTNLLALNAAIEAARAGEHGKGFAVVADEVRKLAERSTRSTQEITKLVYSVQETAEQAVQAMSASSHEVEQGLTLANETQTGLNGIQQAVEQVGAHMSRLAQAVEAMSGSSGMLQEVMQQVAAIVEENRIATEQSAENSTAVMQSIEDMSAIAEENSAAAEEVFASTDEVHAQVEQTVRSAESLARLANELLGLVQQFQVQEANEQHMQPVEIRQNGNGHHQEAAEIRKLAVHKQMSATGSLN
ncbi:MAG: methyl-accepting chemotaxis protein [Caldilineaceae bacterium]